jgi:hypothetical protein
MAVYCALLFLIVAPVTALREVGTKATGRRAVLKAAAACATLPISTIGGSPLAVAGGVPDGMKTSESYTNLQQIAPEVTGTLGAGTMSSRSRPSTGIVLLEDVQEAGAKDAPAVSAELVLDGGVAATVTFQSEPGYPLIRGMFYDVEIKNQKGSDSAFLQVASLPSGKGIAEMSDSFFTKKVFSAEGRFGAYGSATDIKVLNSEMGTRRLIDVTFSALSPGGTEVPRRALIAAIQPEGATDAVMLVGSSVLKEWKKVEPALRKTALSLQVARVRPTGIARKAKNDYRFEDQGGLNERKDDTIF